MSATQTMTTAATSGLGLEGLLGGYDAFVGELGCGAQGKRLRRRAARRFLAAHLDLHGWMQRPTPARLVDLDRTGAWPFLSWCFVEGVVLGDVDLLGAKAKGGHFALWTQRHHADVNRARHVATALGWSADWTNRVCANTLPMVCLTTGTTLFQLTGEILDGFDEALERAPTISGHCRKIHRAQLYGVRQLAYQLELTDDVPRQAWRRDITLADRAAAITQPDIRRMVLRYLETINTVLRPATVRSRAASLTVFGGWLADAHPEVQRLAQLSRAHLEAFLIWTHERASQGRATRGEPISVGHAAHQIVDLKTFFDDLAGWGWAEAPTSALLHRTDIPRPARRQPRALPVDVDQALTAAAAELDDLYARCAITILRGTGLRLGELRDLELDCLWDTPGHGTWLKVPLGKLNTERLVPLDEPTLAAFDTWTAQRGPHRALPHPRDGRPTNFLFVAAGRRLSAKRIRQGLFDAADAAGLRGSGGTPLRPTPHQLRHTYATSLVNAGMSLQALMSLLGHTSPEMTMRYTALADATIRSAYDDAMAKLRDRAPLPMLNTPPPASPAPDHLSWLRSEMLKTRVAHGHCSRHLAAGACPYANICETCDNFTPTPQFLPGLRAQVDDLHTLRDDAQERAWPSEAARHQGVIDHLEPHLRRLENHAPDEHTT